MGLNAQIGLGLGTLDLAADLRVDDDETVAILGPNGAGKTTVLRALAGLIGIDRGRIELDGHVLDDGEGTFVPPERRSTAVVFQDYLLFPHLDVVDNVAFGLRNRGMRRAAANALAARMLDQLGLGDKAHVKPDQLSGGQSQRVALARALAAEPRLLLLDEPLAALDVTTRASVRRDLSRHLRAFRGMRLLVTHDPLDAAMVADRVAILERGRVTQTGTFAEISAQPRSEYAAELVDVNLLRGNAHNDRVTLDGGTDIFVPAAGSGPAFVVIRPRSIALHHAPPAASPRNVLGGRVDSVERFGDRVRVRISGDVSLVAEITPAALDEMALTNGVQVWAAFKATDVAVFPA